MIIMFLLEVVVIKQYLLYLLVMQVVLEVLVLLLGVM